MQKVKTIEYEFMCRMISDVPLYEVRFKDNVYITTRKPAAMFSSIDFWPDMIAVASTARSAWKKTYKILGQPT